MALTVWMEALIKHLSKRPINIVIALLEMACKRYKSQAAHTVNGVTLYLSYYLVTEVNVHDIKIAINWQPS